MHEQKAFHLNIFVPVNSFCIQRTIIYYTFALVGKRRNALIPEKKKLYRLFGDFPLVFPLFFLDYCFFLGKEEFLGVSCFFFIAVCTEEWVQLQTMILFLLQIFIMYVGYPFTCIYTNMYAYICGLFMFTFYYT